MLLMPLNRISQLEGDHTFSESIIEDWCLFETFFSPGVFCMTIVQFILPSHIWWLIKVITILKALLLTGVICKRVLHIGMNLYSLPTCSSYVPFPHYVFDDNIIWYLSLLENLDQICFFRRYMQASSVLPCIIA